MIAVSTAVLALVVSFAAAPVSAQAPELGTVLAGNGNITTYYKLITKFPNILLQLPNYAGVTIVAPNDDAFTKAGYFKQDNQSQVTNILEYHILQGTLATAAVPLGPADYAPTLLENPAYTNVTSGQNVIVYQQPGEVVVFTSGEGSRSTLLYGDIPFAGGLVQIVDTLLVPPSRLEPTCRDAYQELTAFLGALYTAGIVEEFAESKNVTIFAPYNAAFQQLAGTLDLLDKESLAQVLRYHLVPNYVMPSSTLKNDTNLTSAAAGVPYGPALIHVTTAGNNLYLDAAQVIQPDILIANGVVHMIDSLMNPNASWLLPNPALGTQAPAFALTGATATGSNAPTPYTTALPCTVSCPVPTKANQTATSPPSETSSATSSGQTYVSHAAAGALPPGLAGAAGMMGLGVVAMQFAGVL